MTTISLSSQPGQSLVWRLKHGKSEAFVVGTMHVAFPGYEKLVERFTEIIDQQQIQSYFGETDMNDMAAHAGALTGNFLRLSDNLSPKRYANYRKKLLQFTGIDLYHYDLLPPMLLSSMIASQLIAHKSPSMDEILWNHAEKNDIPVAGLESFAEQLKIFHLIPYEYQVRQLRKLLGRLSGSRASLHRLINLYKKQAIHKLYMQGKKSLGPIRSLMLEQRNSLMIDRITRQMKEELVAKPIFISLGAAHLAGKHGIIYGLKKNGLIVKPYVS